MSYGARHVEPEKQLDAQRSCVAAGECRPRARSSKNTRDWCKGHVGVPHAYEWQDDVEWRYWQARHPERHGRWVRQERVCFGCGKKCWQRRTFCRVCGSPMRHWHQRIGTRRVTHGPFCLCPDNFEARATVSPIYGWDRTPPAAWADDPVQIAALRGQAR